MRGRKNIKSLGGVSEMEKGRYISTQRVIGREKIKIIGLSEKEWKKERKNERTNKQTNEWMKERKKERMNERTKERTK